MVAGPGGMRSVRGPSPTTTLRLVLPRLGQDGQAAAFSEPIGSFARTVALERSRP